MLPVYRYPEKLISKKSFFEKFSIEGVDFEQSGLDWNDLKAIYLDYSSWWGQLFPAAQFIANTLSIQPGVHAVRHRVKDPEHLIEKIIRRSKEQRGPWANLKDYKTIASDLIGVRALHLFKDDWLPVNNAIRKHWNLKRVPVANVRESDPNYIIKEFKNAGCKVELRDSGYRSVHYEICAQIAKKIVAVEIQVRTLFEEAWGESSHRVQYPYFQASNLMQMYLEQMSHVAGLGDSLGSVTIALRRLGNALNEKEAASSQDKKKFNERLEHVKQMFKIVGVFPENSQTEADKKRKQR